MHGPLLAIQIQVADAEDLCRRCLDFAIACLPPADMGASTAQDLDDHERLTVGCKVSLGARQRVFPRYVLRLTSQSSMQATQGIAVTTGLPAGQLQSGSCAIDPVSWPGSAAWYERVSSHQPDQR